MLFVKLIYISIFYMNVCDTNSQSGPDPWNYDSKPPEITDELNVPPDIRIPLKRKPPSTNKLGIGEWFFKRTLAIVLKGGNTKNNEDGSVDILLQMKFNPKQWETLNEALKSDSPLSEDMLRRSVGYVEESIHKPSVVEQIVLTWTEYVQVYLSEYKDFITWTLGFVAAACITCWVWSHMSHRRAVVLLFIIFYLYEVVISYKEAEKMELDKFISAVNKCKWHFWTSSCEVPPPDPLVFIKHMNPLKIGLRMFTAAFSEPFIVISGTMETILHGATDGLWYPLDKLVYGVLTVFINISLIFLLVMILFNWLLNIPFSLNVFGVGVNIKDRNRGAPWQQTTEQPRRIEQSDGIKLTTVDNIINLCTLAMTNASGRQSRNVEITTDKKAPKIKRSASTGRLPNTTSFEFLALENTVRRRKIGPHDGGGDAR